MWTLFNGGLLPLPLAFLGGPAGFLLYLGIRLAHRAFGRGLAAASR